jgi:hypothetical protein
MWFCHQRFCLAVCVAQGRLVLEVFPPIDEVLAGDGFQ